MIGTALAHYRITGELGAGGMGEVWRAQDTRLGRDVALKVLSEEFADDAERLERFEREARAVATLNHPHIVTIFSVEEADGVRFLTMELIEGCSLDKLIPDGGLDLATFLALATPLAEAISAAHDKSVIHRDLKPSNVMVDNENRVKVLDFGLAKVSGADGVSDSSEMPTEALTGVGLLVGTVPYMSPEQIEGMIVDHRTDIFSLGVLLYEMATGERPFAGDSQPALMSSILRDVPRSVVEVRDDVPRHLGRIIGRCLEKDRRDRYQTARDVFNELKSLRQELSSTVASQALPRETESVAAPDTRPSSDVSASSAARRDEGFWVAVLPFRYTGGDDDLSAFAEGLSEDIVTGLSRFSYLRVIARGSSATGARYVMEGSLRRAGKKLRVAVQLVDTESGAHLWAEAYDRDFDPDGLFSLQDDLVPRIVSTSADHFGVLARAISEAVRGKPVSEMTPYEALMRGFGYHFRLTPEEHANAREALERAVEQAPSNADCLAMLAWVYAHEFAHDFNPKPNSLDRALEAARRAVDIAPSNHVAQQVLAVVLFFRREFAGCRSAAERAMELNPFDGSNEAFFLITFTGEWERGCALIRGGMELNPHHPGWYRAPLAVNEYRKENYRAAIDEAVKANSPEVFWFNIILAAAHSQLGELEAAHRALENLHAQKPDFARSGRQLMGKWFEPDLVEHLIEGLRKAGLEIGSGVRPAAASLSAGEAPAPVTEAPSIAVLPFTNMSPDRDNDYFSDGLSEEIINALTRLSGLRVIARSSAFRFRGEQDLRKVGEALRVRNVLEGSVRKAGERLRITAQLVDVDDDSHIWSERFDREMTDIFEIQDEIAGSIVDALEIQLTPQEQAQLAKRPIDDVRAQESYLRARSEIWSFMPGSLDLAISHLEAALQLVGDNALIYQGLGECYFQYVNIGAATGREEQFIQKAESCVDKIFALEPESPRGYLVRAQVGMARGDIHDCSRDFQHVLQVYPNEIMALALYTHLLGWLGGKPDAAAPVAARLVDIDPLNPMSRLVSAMVPMFAGRFSEAVDATRRMFDLDPVTPVWRANHVMALSYARQFDEAEALTGAVDAQPDSDVGTWQMGLLRAAWREDREEVLRLADGPYQQVAAWDAEVPWLLAIAHAAVGAKDEAFHWLDRAIDHGMVNYPFLSEHDRFLDNIRGDERFGRSMERARREWERLDEVLP